MFGALTVRLVVDGEAAQHVVGPLGSAEAAALQHHVERFWGNVKIIENYYFTAYMLTASCWVCFVLSKVLVKTLFEL